MKKITVIAAMAFAAMLCGCQKADTAAPETGETALSFDIAIDTPEGLTKTVFDPATLKVNWVSGDKIALKYAHKTGNDNVTLTAAKAGTKASFSGKTTKTNATPSNPSDFVFYYPVISTVAKSGTVTDGNNFELHQEFPKLQMPGNVLFEANFMYGVAKGVTAYQTVNTTGTPGVVVNMKNMNAVLDFTVKGTGSVKRISLTDLDTSAKALWGTSNLVVKNGAETKYEMANAGTTDADRTIILEYNKPLALTAEGAHAYMTVFPRTFAKGVRICIELENGDFMVKTFGTAKGFTLTGNKCFQIPAVTFASTAKSGKGYYEGTEYSYEIFKDERDGNEYRIATLSDGRTWMLDNLRYLPEGYTPSSNKKEWSNGVWYPICMNAAGTAVEFKASDEYVKRYGYLYNASVALDLDVDFCLDMQKAVLKYKTYTAEEALEYVKYLDGAQGICPEGWYIPTKTDYDKLYTSKSSMSTLGVQGFLVKDFGFLQVSNISNTGVEPSTGGLTGYALNKLNMSYILLSTFKDYKTFYAVMANVTNNTAAVAGTTSLNGVAVRCIKRD